jgi:myo-inositol-1(or 4)-monophosphatase
MNAELKDGAALQDRLREAAIEAGAIALRHFVPGEHTSARVWTKGKSSPVTEADIAVDNFLREHLIGIGEDFGWLSEETADSPERLDRERVLVVDPIDGTRAFLAGDPRWCVCIALVARGASIAAVVHAPALAATYEATCAREALMNGQPIKTADLPSLDGARVAGPRLLLEALTASGVEIERMGKIPSLALRLCGVADGSLDAAVAAGDANDWDIAAAHLIVERAGGKLADIEGRVPLYNRATTIHGRLLAAPIAGFDRMLGQLRRAVSLL